MTLLELRKTLVDVVQSGQVGTPVALRLHLHHGSGPHSLAGLVAPGLPLLRAVCGDAPARVHARRHATAMQIDVLLSFEGGASSLITADAVGAAPSNVQLLLIGNHGTARLEGDVSLPADAAESADDPWLGAIEVSLAESKSEIRNPKS